MANDDEELRARPTQLRDYGRTLREQEAQAVATELGSDFLDRLAGHQSLTQTGPTDGDELVAPLAEAAFLAGVLDANSRAVRLFVRDVERGLAALAEGATVIADQYGYGDALSRATVEDVINAFTPPTLSPVVTGDEPTPLQP
ncbi:hypothetical protein [Cryptosporangium sp. NPDC051539]|uniref:hypothetical protein n=1 Tax=Cryptosporangium sp. NPDC051539 TaxID=3363962 RepID=UPI00379B9B82